MAKGDMIPIPMLLHCPQCSGRHIDLGEFATKSHHTHACQHCGHVWRPAIVPTVGVQFLPGFQDVLVVKTGGAVPQHTWTGSVKMNVLWIEGRCAGVLEPEDGPQDGPTQWVFSHASGEVSTTLDYLPRSRYPEVQAWALRQVTEAPQCSR